MRHVTVRQVRRSAGLYPITGLYVGAVLLAIPFTLGVFGLVTGLLLFASLAVLAVLVATWREVRHAHHLLDTILGQATPDPVNVGGYWRHRRRTDEF